MKYVLTFAILATVVGAHGAVLFDNGTYITSGNLSALVSPATTLGFGAQTTAGNAVADDFTLTSTSTLSSLTVYSYQTGSTTTPTFTTGRFAIFSATPTDRTSNILAGTLASDVSVSAVFTGNYRVSSTTPTDRTRPIMAVTFNLGSLNLAAGTYSVGWSLSGSLASGPWAIPTATQSASNNGRQSTGSGNFASVFDAGSSNPQDFAFQISGQPVPEPATMAALGFGALAMLRRRKRA